jgi:hypothetical protein
MKWHLCPEYTENMHAPILYMSIYVQCGRGNTDIPRHPSIPWLHGAKMRSTKYVHDVPPWFVVRRSYCFQCHHRLIWHRFLKQKEDWLLQRARDCFCTCMYPIIYIYIHLACVLNSPGRENKSWRQNRSLEVLASGAHRSHHVALHQPNSYHPRDMPKLCTCQHG